MFRDAEFAMPIDLLVSRSEFDMLVGMTLALGPVRKFTKWSQHRNQVTLAYLPAKIDELLTEISPGRFDGDMRGRLPEAIELTNAFQRRLTEAVKSRFAPIFNADSLALGARYFLPGATPFTFRHFDLPANIISEVEEHLLKDFVALLPPDTPEEEKAEMKLMAAAALKICRRKLDALAEEVSILDWLPGQKQLTAIFDLSAMYLAIPATSADNERSFSSAGFTMGELRTRADIDAFRREHRIRRFLTAGGADSQTQKGRDFRIKRVHCLLDRFAARVNRRLNE